MRRLAILLVAIVAAGAHSCLTLWFGSQKGSPFCWESRLAPI